MIEKYKVEDFLETKSVSGVFFVSSATKLAFISNISGTNQLYLTSREGGELEQVTAYEEPISFAFPSPVKDEILFGMAKGGNEKTQFFLLDIVSKSIRPITNEPNVSHRFGGWSRDGKFITYSSNLRNGTDFDVYVMNMETGIARIIYSPGGTCDSLGFSPTGIMVTVRKKYSETLHDLYLVHLGNSSVTLLTPSPQKGWIGESRWLPDESGFFFLNNLEQDLIGLSFFNLRAKKSTPVQVSANELEGTAITADGKNLALMENKDGYRSVTVYDVEKSEPLENQKFPDGLIGNMRWSEDGKYLAFTFSGAIRNADVWIWSKEKNKYWQVTTSPRKIPEKILIEPKLEYYISFDGLRIPVFLFLPNRKKDSNQIPVVTYIHGGPEAQFRPNFNPLIQYLVYSGYAVAAPNIRGSSGYGKKYLSLDDGKKRMDAIRDLEYLHKFLARYPGLDAKKIALMGSSYGGYMTLAGLTFQPKLWACGVDIVGFSNLVSFLENTSPYRRVLREAEYGSLETDKEFLKSISPLNFINSIESPLLIIHGANDPRVPISEAEQIHEKLNKSGKRSELLVYGDEGHGLKKLKNRLDAYPKIVIFLKSFLG